MQLTNKKQETKTVLEENIVELTTKEQKCFGIDFLSKMFALLNRIVVC